MPINLIELARASKTTFDPIPVEKGLSLWDLPTPALVIDLDAFESNMKRMNDHLAGKKLKLRPHAKTHKCPIIAKRQMQLGAVGICAAKVGEAEVLAAAGLKEILITSPIVTPDKIARVIELAKNSSGIALVVDQEQTVRDLNAAASAAGIKLTVFIDLDGGMHRTGVAPGEAAMKVREAIAASPALRCGGLQMYEGRLMHRKVFAERRDASTAAMTRALEVKAEMEKAGWETPILSGGGTGTYNIDSEVAGVSDLQAGSYVFMDVNYRVAGGVSGALFDDFAPALFVLATAISQPIKGLITVDAGFKAFASDSDLPELRDIKGAMYNWGGDEHGILFMPAPSREIKLGDKLPFIVSHCDPTVNLYDYYWACRGEQVEAIWPISARGMSQ